MQYGIARFLESKSKVFYAFTSQISIATEKGLTCQKWTSKSPHQPNERMVQHQQQNFGDDMNHNFCRRADPKDPRPWCYTTHPSVKYDYCDCSPEPGSPAGPGSNRPNVRGKTCGTVTKKISFDFDRYDSKASVIPKRGRNRIIGGVDAKPGEVPWQVNLFLDGTQLYNLKCGGTLVSSTVTFSVLSATA